MDPPGLPPSSTTPQSTRQPEHRHTPDPAQQPAQQHAGIRALMKLRDQQRAMALPEDRARRQLPQDMQPPAKPLMYAPLPRQQDDGRPEYEGRERQQQKAAAALQAAAGPPTHASVDRQVNDYRGIYDDTEMRRKTAAFPTHAVQPVRSPPDLHRLVNHFHGYEDRPHRQPTATARTVRTIMAADQAGARSFLTVPERDTEIRARIGGTRPAVGKQPGAGSSSKDAAEVGARHKSTAIALPDAQTGMEPRPVYRPHPTASGPPAPVQAKKRSVVDAGMDGNEDMVKRVKQEPVEEVDVKPKIGGSAPASSVASASARLAAPQQHQHEPLDITPVPKLPDPDFLEQIDHLPIRIERDQLIKKLRLELKTLVNAHIRFKEGYKIRLKKEIAADHSKYVAEKQLRQRMEERYVAMKKERDELRHKLDASGGMRSAGQESGSSGSQHHAQHSSDQPRNTQQPNNQGIGQHDDRHDNPHTSQQYTQQRYTAQLHTDQYIAALQMDLANARLYANSEHQRANALERLRVSMSARLEEVEGTALDPQMDPSVLDDWWVGIMDRGGAEGPG